MKTWMICAATGIGIMCGAASVAAAPNLSLVSSASAWAKDGGVEVEMAKKDGGSMLMAKDGGVEVEMAKDGGGWISMGKDGGVQGAPLAE